MVCALTFIQSVWKISESEWNNLLYSLRFNIIQGSPQTLLQQGQVVQYMKMQLTHVNDVALLQQTWLLCFGLAPRLFDYWTTIFKMLSEACIKDIRPKCPKIVNMFVLLHVFWLGEEYYCVYYNITSVWIYVFYFLVT